VQVFDDGTCIVLWLLIVVYDIPLSCTLCTCLVVDLMLCVLCLLHIYLLVQVGSINSF